MCAKSSVMANAKKARRPKAQEQEQTSQAEQSSSEPSQQDAGWKDLIFFRKLDKDVWEAWAWAGVGLFGSAVVIWALALAKLGPVSVKAYGVGVMLTGMLTFPIMIWGMIKTMLNPPIFRPSRTIAFTALMAVSFFAQKPLFEAPVSTSQWKSDKAYKFPVKGPWYVLNGGESMEHNRLATAPAVRYAMALTKLDDKGARHSGDGAALEQFYCYGQPVFAPYDATVVRAVDEVNDNKPGKAKAERGYSGNHVVLKLGPEEFFFVFYLKRGSIAVKEGDQVKAGQKLGECGNSGISDYPQVQFHFQNSAEYPLSEGLPVRFDLRAGGAVVESGMGRGPTEPGALEGGQVVEAVGASAP